VAFALQPTKRPAEGEKLIAFAIGPESFAAPIGSVKETLSPRAVTPLFLVPKVLAGVINLRGEVVAVLDLGELLQLGSAARPPDPSLASIVILRREGGRGDKAAAGLLVDRLLGVITVMPERVTTPPATVLPDTAAYLKGVATAFEPPRPLLVLDIERILNTERLLPYRRAAEKRVP
jgi:purine-binding chemotaxis protein CheW